MVVFFFVASLLVVGFYGFEVPRGSSRVVGVQPRSAAAVTISEEDKTSLVSSTTSTTTTDKSPSLLELSKFTLTAMPIFIAPTLLSLIDTAVVGQRSSLELAAMGPACACVDSLMGLLAFVSVGTTNLSSRAYAESKGALRRVCSVALCLAGFLGLALGLVLYSLAGPERVAAALGGTESAQQMAKACSDYVRIRMFSMPAAVALMAAQAACLGGKDSKTPASATLVSFVVNVIGDLYLVLGPPAMGVAGAAYATVACQYAGFFVCFRALQRRGFLDLKKLSVTKDEVKDFFKFGGFMGVTLAKTITYNQAVYLAASLGPATSAAHQVIYSLSRFCFTLGDTTGATAQAFLPAIYDKKLQRAALLKILILSFCVATVASSVAFGLPTLLPQLFSNDPTVVALMRSAAPWAGLGLLFHPVVVGLEGALLAKGDLPYLLKNYFITGILSVAACLFFNNFIPHLTLPNIWQYLCIYQLTRFSSFLYRALFKVVSPSGALGKRKKKPLVVPLKKKKKTDDDDNIPFLPVASSP